MYPVPENLFTLGELTPAEEKQYKNSISNILVLNLICFFERYLELGKQNAQSLLSV